MRHTQENGTDQSPSSRLRPTPYTPTGGVEDDVGRLRGDLRARDVQGQGRHLVQQLAVWHIGRKGEEGTRLGLSSHPVVLSCPQQVRQSVNQSTHTLPSPFLLHQQPKSTKTHRGTMPNIPLFRASTPGGTCGTSPSCLMLKELAPIARRLGRPVVG